MIRSLVSLSTATILVACGYMTSGAAVLRPAGQRALPHSKVDLRPVSAAALLELIEQAEAEVILVNMWATWCVPCREEFPDIVRLQREYASRGLKVVFVSGDVEAETEQVLEFLAAQGVDFPSYLKVGKDMEFIDTFCPEWSGLLPATFIFDSEGFLLHFWEGAASYEQFESHVLQALDESPGFQPTSREERP